MTAHTSQYQKEKAKLPDNSAHISTDSACKNNYIALQWSIRAVAGSPKSLMQFAVTLTVLVFTKLGWFVWFAWDMFEKETGFLITMISLAAGTCWYYIAASRQKRIYRYKIFSSHGRLVYTPYYSAHVKTIFKTAVFIIVFLLLLAGLMTNFLLFIIGPGGGLLILACVILNWTFPITRERSAPWHLYNYVTVDRKRRFIVTHITDQTLGFEARLPNDELFEQYLAFLRSVLPPDAQYTEKKWNLSTI